MICIKFSFLFIESIYRRGARRWRKLYKVNGHIFQAKRFNRVNEIFQKKNCKLIFNF